ncbi:MAG: AsnC family transcriptional regulator [Methylococcaceae bacterium]|nr:AsnC family transcriptional regulator [Methylococcaceae bacterium]MDP3930939.1 AsnC family transcriptional regulator [Methylococcaceae bacterium]
MIDDLDQRLLSAIQQGLPMSPRPYAQLGAQIGLSESEVLARLTALKQAGLIKRLGVIVKHRQLGYRANAMVVWDIPDEQVQHIGQLISRLEFVNLCYRRPRHGATWPYNLFCMIHGKSKETVLQQLALLEQACHTHAFPKQVLFSRRCFKQRGAIYTKSEPAAAHG